MWPHLRLIQKGIVSNLRPQGLVESSAVEKKKKKHLTALCRQILEQCRVSGCEANIATRLLAVRSRNRTNWECTQLLDANKNLCTSNKLHKLTYFIALTYYIQHTLPLVVHKAGAGRAVDASVILWYMTSSYFFRDLVSTCFNMNFCSDAFVPKKTCGPQESSFRPPQNSR